MIIDSQGHDGRYVLVYQQTGEPVHSQHKILDTKNGDIQWTVVGGRAPHKPSSAGTIDVVADDLTKQTRTWYPQVLYLEWRKP